MPDSPRERHLTVSAIQRNNRRMSSTVVPHLRLSGRWLESAGFRIGDKVRVELEHGRLAIVLLGSRRVDRQQQEELF